MHRHEHHPEPAQRHPIRRPDPEAGATALAARAAAAGRTDALGQASVLRLQRAAGNAGVAQLLDGEAEQASPVKDVIGRGGGTPLEPTVRKQMESSFGTDFSDVRVHTGGAAAASAQAVDAHAYTVGNEIVLGDGQAQGSAGHDRTLAHELTHVVQQRSGPVEGTPAPGGISISSPADRFERAAEATADAVMHTGRAGAGTASGQASGAAVQRERQEEEKPVDEVNRPEATTSEPQRPEAGGGETAGPAQTGATEAAMPEEEEREAVQALAVQRQEEPEEEEVQTLAIQREGVPEEEEEVQTLAIQRAAGDERSNDTEHLRL